MMRASLSFLLTLTVVTGLVYPLVVTGLAQMLFPHQARGSLIVDAGKVKGSELIGQNFEDPKYFWPRLSATGPFPYNAASSSGSNYGPHHPDLKKAMDGRRALLGNAPIDLLTSSGSGLDPDISPAAAQWQAERVAHARHLPLAAVQKLVAQHTQGRQFGVFGEPRVNVLLLNRALDRYPVN